MIRNLKTLGLTAVAVLAMSAMAASAASAAEFHSEGANPNLTGVATSSHDFAVSGFTVECSEAEFTGSQEGTTAETATVHPEYGSCEFFEEPAAVTTTGCNYVFDADEDGSGHADVTVDCEGSSTIEVETGACTMRFGDQTPSQGVHYTNNENGTVGVDATVTNVAIAEKSGPLCFLLGNSGSYSGDAVVSGDQGDVRVE